MTEKQAAWTKEFHIHSYDLDANMNLRPARLMDMFSEIAWIHANHLGFGFEDLQQRNQIWVLGSASIRFHKNVDWGDTLQVYTHISGQKAFYYHRDLALKSIDGKTTYADCRTRWIVLNAESRKPVRHVELPEGLPETLNPLFDDAFPKIVIEENEDSLKPIPERSIIALRDDYDQNFHINNGRYLAWALESYEPDFLLNNQLDRIDVQFTGEGFSGDQISSKKYSFDQRLDCFNHRITNKLTNTDLAKLQIKWQQKA
jgi:acyl-CoA thioesterase FadM